MKKRNLVLPILISAYFAIIFFPVVLKAQFIGKAAGNSKNQSGSDQIDNTNPSENTEDKSEEASDKKNSETTTSDWKTNKKADESEKDLDKEKDKENTEEKPVGREPKKPVEDAAAKEKEEKTIKEVLSKCENGWETVIEPDGEIFPSMVLAMASVKIPEDKRVPKTGEVIGQDDGPIGIRVLNPTKGSKIKVNVKAETIMEESSVEGEMKNEGSIYSVFPKIAWKFDNFYSINQTVPVNLTFEVTMNDKPLGKKVVTARIRGVNDCPYFLYNGENSSDSVDLSWMYAAYVNEDHPWVDHLLKEALLSKIVDSFAGYQYENEEEVYRQVFAIWYALRKKGIKYSSITTTAATSEKVCSQHVRFLEQCVGNIQANCVDGSVLFASVLRKIGIDPFLIGIPGHMFLGFYLDPNHKRSAFLETTLIGAKDFDEVDNLKKLAALLPKSVLKGEMWLSFKNAIKSGRDEYKESKPKIDEGDPEYQVTDIAAVRTMGIMPIAYKKQPK
ncbi:MAG: hypothetical protein HQM08_05150 [Candidatus Riflebacteria bacterium]|nr:hypothetical protein [Candidatus Riflebacteria bacterium]